jgi:hypothetical protein
MKSRSSLSKSAGKVVVTILSACFIVVLVCTSVTGAGLLLPVFAGAVGLTGTGLIRIVLEGTPPTAGSVILSSPVFSSRSALNTGTLAGTPATPVLNSLTFWGCLENGIYGHSRFCNTEVEDIVGLLEFIIGRFQQPEQLRLRG